MNLGTCVTGSDVQNNICRFIRCWDVKVAREIYRITVGLGGLGSGPELCVWSLLALRYTCDFVYLSD